MFLIDSYSIGLRPGARLRPPEKLPLLGEGAGRVAAKLGLDPTKPVTLIPVVALAEPDLLVEVEAIAVLD
ncbi:hypothetical protein [Nocardia harenae]|uniref:hypothetical protein n=1 Tax=Nocardia harenae TaxID=358707 RepID=UPI000B2069EF|nr:hypothetical protein [Nocardia harenae]